MATLRRCRLGWARGRFTDLCDKVTQLTRDASGNLTAITNPLGFTTTLSYDASGRLTSRVSPRGTAPGADPDQFRTRFTYLDDDQLDTITDPLNQVTRLSYDDGGRLMARTNALLRTTTYGYDAADRLTSVTDPAGSSTTGDPTDGITRYGYDQVGNATSRTDANGRVASWAYDSANHVASRTLPGNRRTDYDHDAAGNLVTVTDANGSATSDPNDGITRYVYDQLGRLTSIDYSDSTPDVDFDFDANSNRTSMTDGAGTQTYGFDDLDRLVSVVRGADAFSYRYDAAGNLDRRTYPGGTETDYGYDDDGRLVSAAVGTSTTSYEYDRAGHPISALLPNGVRQTRTYDRAGRVASITNQRTGDPALSSFAYTYDAVGNPLTALMADGKTDRYGYDSLDRLTDVCFDAPCLAAQDIQYGYDAVGNRLLEDRSPGATTYAYDSADQMTSTSGPNGTVAYGYDENGSQTSAGARTFTYDLAGRLSATNTGGGPNASFTYDGTGNRLSATVNGARSDALWDQNAGLPQLAIERDAASNTLRRYTYGLDRISVTTPAQGAFYYSHDALGSVYNVTTSAGSKAWSYGYEPFGAVRSQTHDDPAAPDQPMRFGGELADDQIGQIHLRARQYDPSTGRFTATDPLAPSATSPYPSTYVYAANRPTTLIDPSGMGAVWPQDDCNWTCKVKELAIGDPLHNPIDAITLIPIFKPVKALGLMRAAKGGGLRGRLADESGSFSNLSLSQIRTVRSLHKQIGKHQQKLDAYRADPDAFYNLGHLRNAPTPEIRQRIIDSRIGHLEGEISTFQKQIDDITGGG